MNPNITNERMTDIVFSTVVPLTTTIIKEKNKRLEFIGSGFLLKLQKSFFLITAAHVLDHFASGERLLINANDGLIKLHGTHARTATNDPSGRKKDKIDFGFVLINEEHYSLLNKIPHLSISDLDCNNEVMKEKGYVITGCPVSKNKKPVSVSEKLVAPKFLVIVCWQTSLESHMQLKAPLASTLALHYDKKEVYIEVKKVTSSDLKCLSGSPIWGITDDDRNLVSAMLTEHHQGSKKSILATRIDAILPILLSVASNPHKYTIHN